MCNRSSNPFLRFETMKNKLSGSTQSLLKWHPDAEKAIGKAPFFVRKRIRSRVEKEALENGKTVVTLAEVKATQQRFLNHQEKEIKGYQIDTCFGHTGCPMRAITSDGLVNQIENIFERADILGFLKQQVDGKLKFHHEFRVTIADCPNACSQPQIKDIGIIGAVMPKTTDKACSLCEACTEVCKETAIELSGSETPPRIDPELCVRCGQCIPVCPTKTIVSSQTGYRVLLGGRLGRHPRLAIELSGLYDEAAVLRIVAACIDLYKQKSRDGKRFAHLLTHEDIERLTEQFRQPHPSPDKGRCPAG